MPKRPRAISGEVSTAKRSNATTRRQAKVLQELNLAARDLTDDKKAASILLLAQIGYGVATATINLETTALRF